MKKEFQKDNIVSEGEEIEINPLDIFTEDMFSEEPNPLNVAEYMSYMELKKVAYPDSVNFAHITKYTQMVTVNTILYTTLSFILFFLIKFNFTYPPTYHIAKKIATKIGGKTSN